MADKRLLQLMRLAIGQLDVMLDVMLDVTVGHAGPYVKQPKPRFPRQRLVDPGVFDACRRTKAYLERATALVAVCGESALREVNRSTYHIRKANT